MNSRSRQTPEITSSVFLNFFLEIWIYEIMLLDRRHFWRIFSPKITFDACDDTLTMEPPFFSAIIPLTTSWLKQITDFRFTLNDLKNQEMFVVWNNIFHFSNLHSSHKHYTNESKLSGFTSRNGSKIAIPALFTKTWMGSTCFKAFFASSQLPKSTQIGMAVGSSATNLSKLAFVLDNAYTLVALHFIKAFTKSLPIPAIKKVGLDNLPRFFFRNFYKKYTLPWPAPVTRTFLFSKDIFIF